MKPQRKIFTRSAVVLVLFFFGGALYLRIGIFPGKLREVAGQKIEQWTHKKVVFDRAVFIPFHGLSLTRVGVFEPDGRPLFQARRVTVNVRLLPFLAEKKIVVNRCLLDGAFYDWSLAGEKAPAPSATPKTVISGQIAVPTVPENRPPDLKDIRNGPDFFLPENVYIERIEIADGRLVIRAD